MMINLKDRQETDMKSTYQNKQDKQKSLALFQHVALTIMAAVWAALLVYAVKAIDLNRLSAAINVILSLTTLLFTMLLFYLCLNSHTWSIRQKKLFDLMLLIFFIEGCCSFFSETLTGRPETGSFVMISNTLLYIFSSMLWMIFLFFQEDKYQPKIGRKAVKLIFYIFFGCYAAAAIINCFNGFCFYVDPNGTLVMRSFFLVYMTAAWFVIYLCIILSSKAKGKIKFTLASYALAPLLEYLLIIPFRGSSFFLSIFTNLGFFLYLISLYLLFFSTYVEWGRELLQREKELEESKANAMMLKISPHFIANTMSSIVALCDPGAPKAMELAQKFAKYLHDNYAEISSEPLISFSRELSHINNYLAVEQIRFPDLKIEYDTKVTRFYIPTLTVQPLVENAVRHGISKKTGSKGTVRISSAESDNAFIIKIEDDGIGFDTSKPIDENRHIGIANSKARLDMLCEGILAIESSPGKGTACTITIPKGTKA